MELSVELQRYCRDHIYELATVFNSTLSSGTEYEPGFNEVMNILDVPETKRENIFLKTKYFSDASGIPYHKLSPVNQFLATVVPYIFYCLENSPPTGIKLQEIKQLMDNEEFIQYLSQLGGKISQEVKGALWRPGTGFVGKVAVVLIIGAILSIWFFLLKKASFQNIEPAVSYSIGGLLVFGWIYFLFIGKRYTRLLGSVHTFTAWQYNILPLLTAICLFLTGYTIFVPLGIVFWFAPPLLTRLFPFDAILGPGSPYILSFIYGYFIGTRIGELFSFSFPYWRLASGVVGIVVIQVVCSLILNFVTGLYDRKT